MYSLRPSKVLYIQCNIHIQYRVEYPPIQGDWLNCVFRSVYLVISHSQHRIRTPYYLLVKLILGEIYSMLTVGYNSVHRPKYTAYILTVCLYSSFFNYINCNYCIFYCNIASWTKYIKINIKIWNNIHNYISKSGYIYTCIDIHSHTYINMHTHTYIHPHIHAYTHTCIRTYIQAHIYTYTQRHT